MVIKNLIRVILIVILIQIGYSVNCGDSIFSNTILTEDLNCAENGLKLISGSLNCNGFTIKGNSSGNGVIISGEDYKRVENCRIENFDNGIYIGAETRAVGSGWGSISYILFYPEDTIIRNNSLKNNQNGILTVNSNSEQIYDNEFENNSLNGISLTSRNALVWNNSFNNNKLFYTQSGNNKYCNNNIANFYYGNATGPKCECEILYDNLLVNSQMKICPQEYNISKSIKVNNANLDCSFSTLNGNGTNIGIEINGTDNNIIKNCIFSNFSVAINSYDVQVLKPGVLGGSYYQRDYPQNNFYLANEFKNNIQGIRLINGYNEFIENNSFNNNYNYSIYLNSFSSNLGGNLFQDFGPNFQTTSNKDFCYNNNSNIYLENTSGPHCDCFIPFENMTINSRIKLCTGEYNLIDGITITSQGSLDCQNSKLIGNDSNYAIQINGASNLEVKNCNIENYKMGVLINSEYKTIGYSTYKYISNNINLTNLKISKVDFGINMQDGSFAEEMHNSSIIAKNYTIYNDVDSLINATNNFWGFVNSTEIENSFFKKENIIYNPFINDSSIDFKLKSEYIEILTFENKAYLHIKNLKEGYLNYYTNINLYAKNNGKIVYTQNYSQILIDDSKKILKLDLNSTQVDEIYIIIDPENKIPEINEGNNIAKLEIEKYKYFINVNTKIKVADFEIKDYFKDYLKKYLIVDDISKANVIINITTKNSIFDSFSIENQFQIKKPYEASIKSYADENNIQIIEINGEDIDGILAAIEQFTKSKEKFTNYNCSIIINEGNLDAIGVYDYLHNKENYLYYKTETNTFENQIKTVLEKNKYEVILHNFTLNYNDQNLEYRLIEINPKNSLKFIQFIDKDNYPIVFAGGLWSNISTWDSLAKKFANQGYQTYLIELTGNEKTECENCYNYDYEFLTNKVYPLYIDTILNLSNKSKIKYIGHSNGARVSLDSLSKGELNPKKIDTLILVGVPGSFETLSFFGKLLNKSNNLVENIEKENITHITFSQVAHKLKKDYYLGEIVSLMTSSENNKISTNLFREYLSWIQKDNDLQPGKNININYFGLIYGKWLLNEDDTIVSIVDERKIYENINSENKYLKELNTRHDGMANDKNVQMEIEKMIKKEVFTNEN